MNRNSTPFVVGSTTNITVTYDTTVDKLSKAKELIPQPNVPTSQTTELRTLLENMEGRLRDVKIEMDAKEEELRESQPKFITVLKRLLLIDPGRRYLRKMKDIHVTGEGIEHVARHTTLRRKTIEPLFGILDTHDLPNKIESLGKASDYPLPISDIRGLQKPTQRDKVQEVRTEALVGSDMYEYAETREMYISLVRSAINFYIDALTMKENKLTDQLAQLSHWICFIVIQTGYHMGRRSGDLEFVSEITPAVASVINILQETIDGQRLVVKSSIPSPLFEVIISKAHADARRLSALVEERMKLPPQPYKAPEEDFIKFLVDGVALSYKKTDLTVLSLREIVCTKLKVTVLDSEECTEINYSEATSGSYGSVHLGEYQGQKMAFKLIKRETSLPEWQQCVRYLRELHIWRTTDGGPYIQKLRGIHMRENMEWLPAFVSPWCSNGTLDKYLADEHILTRLELMHQVSIGLKFLHSKEIVHGDLRTNNILVDNGEVRLTDFGISRMMVDFDGFSSGIHGNSCWIAPELLQDNDKSQATDKADVFSFGRVLFAVLTNTNPYSDRFPSTYTDRRVVGKLVTATPPQHPTQFTKIRWPRNQDYISLMHRCWDKDAASRPSAAQLVKDMFELVKKCKEYQD